MERDMTEGIRGWLLVYLVGSILLLMLYSMGLAGWFFDYPVVLMIAIFLILALPLLLILLKRPIAPLWNIAELWIIVILMALRSTSVFLMPVSGEEMSSEEIPLVVLTLLGIVSVSVGWALTWTKYFRISVRVRNTFC